MKKQFYLSPELSEVEFCVERGFAVSGDTIWYEEPGKGDFTYDVETDSTWG